MSTVADPFWTSRVADRAERPGWSWPLSLATSPHRKQPPHPLRRRGEAAAGEDLANE